MGGAISFHGRRSQSSGGPVLRRRARARILIAQLMVQPADVLLLDEPTNDLDIPTLEILEESLLEFGGALVLVTHDRYMLDRVSTVVLGLDGLGEAARFADYSQWDDWQRSQLTKLSRAMAAGSERPRSAKIVTNPATRKTKLSFGETREFETIEQRVAEAEGNMRERHARSKIRKSRATDSTSDRL